MRKKVQWRVKKVRMAFPLLTRFYGLPAIFGWWNICIQLNRVLANSYKTYTLVTYRIFFCQGKMQKVETGTSFQLEVKDTESNSDIKSSCFTRRPQKLTKSSPSIWHYVVRCQINGEDFVNFCGLLRKHEL